VTAAGRRGPRLRWRPLPRNLTGRRGAALALPILLAVGLNVAAVAGLADIAGFRAVYTSLTRIRWPWLGAVPAALAMSATGYYFAYRSIYAAEGGYQLSRRKLTAVVAVGFGGLFDTGGIGPDGLVLQASGAGRREAMVRLTTLAGMEQAMLALYGCAASIAWLSLGRAGVPANFTLPWAVIPVPAFAAAFWLAGRYRVRLQRRSGCRARLAVFLDAVLLIRALFTRPVRHRGAIGGMALFWAGDALAVWSALAAFGVAMNGAALLIGYSTGMVFTRRTAPLAGAGTLALILPLTICASGVPLATAITGVAAYRALCFWLPLPSALASLPVLRQATRQAAITRQEPSSSVRTPASATPGPTSPTSS
jgi:glycosyltransferase 2 family protein